MELQRVEARIAREDLPHAARGGIAFENALDVFTHAAEHDGLSARSSMIAGSFLNHACGSIVFPTKIINY
jgi:hypothetical protein